MKKLRHFILNQPPARLIALGFASTILLGTLLLLSPLAVRPGVTVHPADALFSATSAVCVTGLLTLDTADTFTFFGQAVMAVLIQIGGLGITSIGIGLALAAGRRISLKERTMIREAMNVDSLEGMVRLMRAVIKLTLAFETIGILPAFAVFVQDYPPLKALWLSIFHSVSSFNNAGIDILGGSRSLSPYRDNVLLNLSTCLLIILGGIGFLVMLDVVKCRFRFRKFTLHSKVVLTTTAVLLAGGTLLLRLTEPISWLTAFFLSVSSRTAGFAPLDLGGLTNAGLFTIILLMFIGASPGSTGGGIKTTTFFVLMQEVRCIFSKRRPGAFRRALPANAIPKASTLALLGALVVCFTTFSLCVLQPEIPFLSLFFEAVSAYSTAGLSTGITSQLCLVSKLILIFTMYIGRVGAFTLLSIWVERPEPSARFTEESITIG